MHPGTEQIGPPPRDAGDIALQCVAAHVALHGPINDEGLLE